VAIKVLPASLSENTDRLNRFEQEARAVGALNHPNILVIHHMKARLTLSPSYSKARHCMIEWRARHCRNARPSTAHTDRKRSRRRADKGIVHRDLSG